MHATLSEQILYHDGVCTTVLPGNNLTRIPALQALGKLQILDLSKNNISTMAPGAFPSELGPTLRSLNLEGNRYCLYHF